MATLVGEIPGIDSISEDAEGIRKIERQFRVKDATSSFDALRCGGIPARFEAHPEDFLSVAMNGAAKPEKNGEPGFYIVTITYSNDYKSQPQDERPEVSWEDEEFTTILLEDRNGTPVINAAGDRYEEPIEVSESRPVLRVVRNESFFDQLQAYKYNRSTNSDTFYGAVPGTMRVKMTGRQMWRDDQEYWQVTYLFRYNPTGWQPQVLEQGLRQIVMVPDPLGGGGSFPIKTMCTVKGKAEYDSEPVTYSVPLDADGKQVDPDLLPGAAVYTEWEHLEPLPYNALGV